MAMAMGTALEGSFENMATPPERARTPDPTCQIGNVPRIRAWDFSLGCLGDSRARSSAATWDLGSLSWMHIPTDMQAMPMKTPPGCKEESISRALTIFLIRPVVSDATVASPEPPRREETVPRRVGTGILNPDWILMEPPTLLMFEPLPTESEGELPRPTGPGACRQLHAPAIARATTRRIANARRTGFPFCFVHIQ
jgi:hypothetical protein